jgi:hypothetical protein
MGAGRNDRCVTIGEPISNNSLYRHRPDRTMPCIFNSDSRRNDNADAGGKLTEHVHRTIGNYDCQRGHIVYMGTGHTDRKQPGYQSTCDTRLHYYRREWQLYQQCDSGGDRACEPDSGCQRLGDLQRCTGCAYGERRCQLYVDAR